MKNIKTVLLSLLVMALWGSLFPVIKIGYKALNITSGFIPDILLFAGFRFVISGLLMCLYCIAKKEKLAPNKAKSVGSIVIMGLFSIVLHYGLHYIGLSTTDSSKAALTKQLGALLYVCFSFLFIKNEKFSLLKMIGSLDGFGGIISINYIHNG